MKAFYTLILVVLGGTAYGQSNLPVCQGNNASKWSNCIGEETINGQRYELDVLDFLYPDFKVDKYVFAFQVN